MTNAIDFQQSGARVECSGTEELRDCGEGLARYNRDVVKKIAGGFGVKERVAKSTTLFTL